MARIVLSMVQQADRRLDALTPQGAAAIAEVPAVPAFGVCWARARVAQPRPSSAVVGSETQAPSWQPNRTP
jgi:hypothetical protein